MKKYKILLILLFFWLIGNGYVFSASMLPEGLIIEESFAPGSGVSVGKIQLVQGEVIIIHEADELRGYRAKDELPLFKGDTVITLERGRVRFELEDGSILTLGSETRLAITRSIYDPANKNRSSFINMATGKARFWVKKLADFSQSDFKVKTQTAIVGVRGSDFIVNASENITEVTTLDKTVLEIVSLSALEKKTLLKDFERTMVKRGLTPSEVVSVPAEEIEKMMKDMTITPGRFEPGAHEKGMERRDQKKGAAGEPNARPEFERSVLRPGMPENKIPGEKSEPSQGEKNFANLEPGKEGNMPLSGEQKPPLLQIEGIPLPENAPHLNAPLPQIEGMPLPETTQPLNAPLPQIEGMPLPETTQPLNAPLPQIEGMPMPDEQPPTTILEDINKIPSPEAEFVKPEDMGYPTEPEKIQIDIDVIDKAQAPPDKDSDKYKPKQYKEDNQKSDSHEQRCQPEKSDG